jgi:transposase
LHQEGWSVRRIAAALGVCPSAVSQWLATARQEGPEGLRSRPRSGAPAKLTPAQRRLIPDFLWHGAEAYGFRGDVWTCGRVAHRLEQEFGVAYSRGHVSRLLKDLGWTPQVPLTRALPRDEAVIEDWRVNVWPALRRHARRQRRTVVFLDESGFYLLPGVVRTYAPQGETPVLWEWQSRDHLSAMGAVTPQGKVLTLVRQHALTGVEVIAFLEHVLRHLKEDLLLFWDGSPIHRRAEVREFLEDVGARRLRVERLPPYAPDLNPVEWLWRQLKQVEMRNLACLDLEELHEEFHLAVSRVRQKPKLIPSFFAGAELKL